MPIGTKPLKTRSTLLAATARPGRFVARQRGFTSSCRTAYAAHPDHVVELVKADSGSLRQNVAAPTENVGPQRNIPVLRTE